MLLPILSVILGALAFSPLNLYPIGFVFLVPLFIFFLKEKKLVRLLLGTLLFRFLFFLGTIYFSLEPIFWLTSLGLFLILPLAIYFFRKIINFVLAKYAPKNSGEKIFFWANLFFLPVAWVFSEILTAHFSLLPTYGINAGSLLGSSPFVGLATLGGLNALTFFLVIINTLATILFFKNIFCKKRVVGLISILFILLLFWSFSSLLLHRNFIHYSNLPHTLKLAAISVSAKENFSPQQLNLIGEKISQENIAFLILPENIFNQTFFLKNPLPNSPETFLFQNLAQKLNISLIATYDTWQNNQKYNSAILFDSQGNIVDIHNKNRLTFVGEYWPWNEWHPSFYDWLKKQDPSLASYAVFDTRNADQKGEQNLLQLKVQEQEINFAAPICLEAYYPNDLKNYHSQGARFIINQTNNHWNSSGLKQLVHLAENLKRIEAVWLSLPIVTSGVDAPAEIILPNGQVQQASPGKDTGNPTLLFEEIRY